jgi:arylsulfatase A-like enzyme
MELTPSRATRPNVLLITLDQFRGDTLSCAGHPLVRTPNLDRLAAAGVRLARHYAQAAPCGPGRAALYTGTYQMNNRVVVNGTPLDDRFDNVARAARRAGYVPTLFGYTDQGVDPRLVPAGDPRLSTYEGILPGFEVGLELLEHQRPWLRWLESLGHRVYAPATMLATEPDRPAEHSVSSFLTDSLLGWLDRQDEPWFAHASYLRPHPPYAAAGHWSRRYDPADCPAPIGPCDGLHPFTDALRAFDGVRAPDHPDELRRLRAQYYGMVSEVDHQLGRLWQWLDDNGAWDDTVIVVTADHADQLGDHGLIGKVGFFESSYHIIGIVRDPSRGRGAGSVIERFTENVDVLPTMCEAMGIDVPVQCDGLPLTPMLDGADPPWWRTAAHYEFDWRQLTLASGPHRWPWDRVVESQSLVVARGDERAYVQFADGDACCFDLAGDPSWATMVTDPAVELAEARALLAWRAQHAERTLSGMILRDGGIGRWPDQTSSRMRASSTSVAGALNPP